MPATEIPERPLDRFLEVQDALLAGKRWYEDASAFRYAASTLVTLPGDPEAIAGRLLTLAADLEQRAGWFGPLNSAVRFVVAAMLLGADIDAAGFTREVERLGELFQQAGLRRRSVMVHIAILLLLMEARRSGRAAGAAEVQRMAALYAEMKRHHRFLTGEDDYPACALLSATAGSAQEIGERCERFYDGLRGLGFSRGNALQSVSHALVFAPDDDHVVMGRFRALYEGFDQAGLWMHTGDYDEVAALSFLDLPASRVVTAVLGHREVIAGRKPKPGRELSFSLACGTAFLELAGGDELRGDLRATQNVLAVQAIIQAQQAAMVAAAVSASAAAASSS